MKDDGYIKLFRKLKENPISSNLELLGLFTYILLDVNFKEKTIYRGTQKIVLNPGEKLFSQRGYAEKFGVSISKIHRYLKILNEEGILKHEGGTCFTIVKLNNWHKYNGSETRKEHEKNTDETQIETNKNVKKEKKDNTVNSNTEIKISEIPKKSELLSLEKKQRSQEIDFLISEIKKVCDEKGYAYENTNDRNFARHILTAKEIGEFSEKFGMDRVRFAKNICAISATFWKGPCAGPMSIYKNYAEVFNSVRLKQEKEKKKEIINIT